MGQSFTKTEKLIGAIVLALVAGFVSIFTLVGKASKFSGKDFEQNQRINYQMARPESPYSEYTIEGRELDQIYEGLEPAQIAQIKEKKKLEKTIAAKKEEKKKAEAKKQAAKKAQAAQLAQSKKIAQNATAKKNLSATSPKKSSSSPNETYTPGYVASAVVSQDSPTPNDQVAKKKKTFAEWRSQIFDNPTPENLALFIAALRKNEVTVTEYQAMAQDLLEQEELKYKALGLQALRSVPSLNSLSQLVHAQPSLSDAYKSYVDQALIAYFYPQNMSFLAAALRTQDRVVVTKVLSLLNEKLNELNDGGQNVFVDSRNLRANTNVNITLNSFTPLIPALTAIIQSQDPEFAGIAQAIAALISTTNNVAQN